MLKHNQLQRQKTNADSAIAGVRTQGLKKKKVILEVADINLLHYIHKFKCLDVGNIAT